MANFYVGGQDPPVAIVAFIITTPWLVYVVEPFKHAQSEPKDGYAQNFLA